MATVNLSFSLMVASAILSQMPNEIPGIQYGAMGLLGLSMVVFSIFLSKAWKDLILIISKSAENERAFITVIQELKSSIERLNQEVKDWQRK